ncbi:4'-phosphopantetheinyl transferase family protein [Bacteroidota bacterium]
MAIHFNLHLPTMPVVYARTINTDTRLCVWHAIEDAESLHGELLLTSEDEKIYASIRNQNRKLQWLGCRMALSHLMQTPKIGIRYDEFGKPSMDSILPNISFTHTGLFAAAICSSSCGVGIDLEQVREKISRVAERFLTTDELTMASGEDRKEVLTLFWAAKEALYKINGKPDVDIQHDISIESFDYLCTLDGEVKALLKAGKKSHEIEVSYHRMNDDINDYMMAWAMVADNN